MLKALCATMPDPAMPDPVIIQNRPRRALAMTALWLLQALVGLGFVASGLRWLGARENGAAIVLLAMGLLLVAAGILMAAQALRIARLKGPAIRLDPQGLSDFRIPLVGVPWDAVTWRLVFNGRSYAVHLAVAAPERGRLSPHWEQRVLARFHRSFGYPEFAVPTLGTGLHAPALAEAFRRFRPESR